MTLNKIGERGVAPVREKGPKQLRVVVGSPRQSGQVARRLKVASVDRDMNLGLVLNGTRHDRGRATAAVARKPDCAKKVDGIRDSVAPIRDCISGADLTGA